MSKCYVVLKNSYNDQTKPLCIAGPYHSWETAEAASASSSVNTQVIWGRLGKSLILECKVTGRELRLATPGTFTNRTVNYDKL